MSTAPRTWCWRPQPRRDARLRLYCFPYAGGSPAVFRGWPDLLPAGVEVCAVNLPGRAQRIRERPCDTVAAMVADVTAGLAAESPVPFVFFGHSLGGLVAFEAARALRRRGAPLPELLMVSASLAPQCDRSERRNESLSDASLIAKLKRWNGTPPEILENQELLAFFLPVVRADLHAHNTYDFTPEPPLDVPIVAYGGTEDPLTREEDLVPWGDLTTEGFALERIAGDHFFLSTSRAELLPRMAAALGPILYRLQGGAAPATWLGSLHV